MRILTRINLIKLNCLDRKWPKKRVVWNLLGLRYTSKNFQSLQEWWNLTNCVELIKSRTIFYSHFFNPLKYLSYQISFSSLSMFYVKLHHHKHTFKFTKPSLEIAYLGNLTPVKRSATFGNYSPFSD